MDVETFSISPENLYARLGTALAPSLIDVRPRDAFGSSNRLIVSGVRREAEDASQWVHEVQPGRTVVVYCAHGHEVSQGVAAILGRAGVLAAFLEGGFARWQEQHLPTRRKYTLPATKWVTRARPKIDRIACPWLVRRFIDPHAEFLYVPAAEVLSTATKVGGVPYDIEDVEFAHEGDRCSFDTIMRIFDIKDAALDQLATIVRGADTSLHELAPQCGGLFAISLGLSANMPNDYEMLAHGMVIYDALYAWCRSLQAETHNWPAKKPAVAGAT